MKDKEKEILFRIYYGKDIIKFENREIHVQPPNHEVVLHIFCYINELKDNIDDDISIQDLGWTRENENRLKKLEDEISKTKIMLFKSLVNFGYCEKERPILRKLEKEYSSLLVRKSAIFSKTQVGMLEEMKNSLISVACIKNVGTSFDSIMSLSPVNIKQYSEIYTHTIPSVKQIRKVCRGIMYNMLFEQNNGLPLDKHEYPILEQIISYSWYKKYKAAIESYYSPTQKIMEDDDAFDGWIEWINKKTTKQSFETLKEEINERKNTNTGDFGAKFIPVQNEEDVKRVQSLNDSNVSILDLTKQ